MTDRDRIEKRLALLQASLSNLETQARELLELLDAVSSTCDRLRPDTAANRLDGAGQEEYLSIRALAQRLPYAEQTIRNLMAKGIFRLDEHYVKPRSRVMFRWSKVRDWLEQQANGR